MLIYECIAIHYHIIHYYNIEWRKRNEKFQKSIFSIYFSFNFCIFEYERFAAENYNSNSVIRIKKNIDDSHLSRKESVIRFMNQHPEYKDEIIKILKDNKALNADGSIKDDLGISNTANSHSIASLYTGYKYTFGNIVTIDSFPQETVAKYTNYTYSPKNFSVSQSYTVSTSFYEEASIGSKAKLEEVYEVNAGAKFSYTYTESATTQLGSQVSVPANTTGILKASPIKDCYGFMEQYYLFGAPVGDDKVVGVFKPTGVHWYYSEEAN